MLGDNGDQGLSSDEHSDDPPPAMPIAGLGGVTTPLHQACGAGDLERVSFILSSEQERSVFLNAYNTEGDTSLHLATREGHLEIVKELVKAGAVVDVEDAYQSTPLHDSAQDGCTAMVEYLISVGATVNRFDKNGGTPLHDAAWEGHFDTVDALLQAGAVPEAMNMNGHTPIQMAEKAGHEDIVAQIKDFIQNRSAMDIKKPAPRPRSDARRSGEFRTRPRERRSSTEIAIAMDLDPQFMESKDYTKLASGYEKALADVHKDFAAAQYLVDEEFQMEQAHMQNDFDDAVEKLEQEFRLAKLEHETKYQQDLMKQQQEKEAALQNLELQARKQMEKAQAAHIQDSHNETKLKLSKRPPSLTRTLFSFGSRR
mmetsp:Transcript_10422/g.19792  ORF Transcript_10422/g.19792 Transcript_10422/m.19792 type:complete len:370 (-) Transcript_10422:348-1457(-)